MKVFISSAHNRPSGGTKVLNQMVNLFREKKIEAWLVIPDKTEKATFLDNPAPTCDFNDVLAWCTKDDVLIDCWQSKISFETAKKANANKKIFWQHGASIPIGPNVVDEDTYKEGTPYTDFWNVSNACADYIKKKYNVSEVSIVHPFFDTEIIKKYEKKVNLQNKSGVLLLFRRGKSFITDIVTTFENREKITVLREPFHEEDFLKLLVTHKFFVSVDPGVDNSISLKKYVKDKLRCVFDKNFRKKHLARGKWIVPKSNLLGFPMPPVEAALLNCNVVGFAMGGGLEWMNTNNCFLAVDRDKKSLLENVYKALDASNEELKKLRNNAKKSVSFFTKEHTWNQISNLLDIK